MFRRTCAHNNGGASSGGPALRTAMRGTLRCIACAAALISSLALLVPLPAAAEDPAPAAPSPKTTTQIIVNVSVNTEIKGDFYAELDDEGHVFLKSADLDALKLNYARERVVLIRGERCVSLNDLVESRYVYDENKLTLAFIGKTTEAGKTAIDVFSLSARPQNIYYPRETSVFLNYGLTYAYTDVDGFQSFSATNKLGARTGDVFIISDSLYTKTPDTERFVRLQSSATYERRGDLQWFVLGDRFASSGDLGSSVNMGGIGVSKVYRLDPYFITQPVFNIKGSTMFPSQAEIYLDGALVSKQTIAPGSFELKNLYSFSGAHTVDVVLRDPFGNEQRISQPAYFSPVMLREGLHEYSYNVGFLREQYGTESNEYGKAVFSAFHRYGVTNSLNIGGRAEGSDGVYNGGLSAAVVAPRLGAFNFSVAGSDAKGVKGTAGMVQHTYQIGSFNTNLLLRGYSREYATVMSLPDPAVDRTKSEASIGAGFLLQPLGSISLVYLKTESHGGSETRVASANYTRSLTRTTTLYATASETRQAAAADPVYSVYVGLSINLDGKLRGALQFTKTDGTTAETAQLQKDVPVGEGVGYRAALSRTETDGRSTSSFNPFVQYNGRYGIYSLDSLMQRTAGKTAESYNLSVAGSLVYAAGFAGASRPVSDSFGIVMAGNLPNAVVQNNGQEIGKTNAAGAIVVPTLTSYGQNQITLDVKNVPMDYSISGVNKTISPSLWSGACISFDAVRIRAVTGRLVAVQDSAKTPIEYQEGKITIGARSVTFPTGKSGEFYLENVLPHETKEAEDLQSCRTIAERRATGGAAIKAGQYPATLEYGGRIYRCTITFPETEAFITELGEIPCVMHREEAQQPGAPAPQPAVILPQPAPQAPVPQTVSEHGSITIRLRFDRTGNLERLQDRRALADLARRLGKDPALAVAIEVHGDRHGTERDRERTGERAAEQLRRALIRAGVRPARIAVVENLGKSKMLCAEETSECDQVNRRAVYRLVNAGPVR